MKFLPLLVVPTLLAFAQTPNIEKDARVGYGSIKAEDLKRFDTYLSSDALQGRETSYLGEKMASKYIGDHFKTIGLKPIGDDGSYFQHYDVELTRVSDESKIDVTTKTESKTFSWLNDFFTVGPKDTTVTRSEEHTSELQSQR